MNLWHLLCGKYALIHKDQLHKIQEESRVNKSLWEQANDRNAKEVWLEGYYVQKLVRCQTELAKVRRENEELRKKGNE